MRNGKQTRAIVLLPQLNVLREFPGQEFREAQTGKNRAEPPKPRRWRVQGEQGG